MEAVLFFYRSHRNNRRWIGWKRRWSGRTLCASMRPGLARSADLACSAARPNGDGSLLPPVYAARSHASLTRGSGRHAAPNRGYCLPARSAALIAPTHPEEKSDGSEAMAAGHPAGHESGMVGDRATLVSPAMARAAAPWWGEPRGTDGFFVDEPLPRWVACCCSSTKIRRAGDANPTKPPCGRHGGVYGGRWSTTYPSRLGVRSNQVIGIIGWGGGVWGDQEVGR